MLVPETVGEKISGGDKGTKMKVKEEVVIKVEKIEEAVIVQVKEQREEVDCSRERVLTGDSNFFSPRSSKFEANPTPPSLSGLDLS